MEDLKRRGLIWSEKAPTADYAEYLVARYFGVEPILGVIPATTDLNDKVPGAVDIGGVDELFPLESHKPRPR